MPQLDLIDKQILGILSADCRTPYREIAKSLGMSATSIKSRVDELVESGLITDFVVEFAPAMLNSEIMMIWLSTDTKETREKFILDLSSIRGVMQIAPLYGGDYLIFAEYTSALEMAIILEELKRNNHVVSTEAHALLGPSGKKVTLTNLQLRVLKALIKDARMQMKDIARESGLTVRIARRTLQEIKDSEAIRFSLRWRLNVGERVTFFLRLKWDLKLATREEIMQLLAKDHLEDFWMLTPSATEPFLVGVAIVDNLNKVDVLTNTIRSYPPVTYAEPFIYRPPFNFKSIRRIALEELIQEAGV
jgi:DNA-binding Lrp family transcriptional regulator